MIKIFCIFIYLLSKINAQIKGVSLGSLYVLEPFITPHLFYPFLGNNERVISDTYSLCDYLGPYKTNKILQEHWKDWINEDIIDTLFISGINTIRIPVGDYMYLPYGPYSIVENGYKCFDGSIEHLDKILNYMNKYKFKIILDIHAWKDSQNGFDNSGETKNINIIKKNDTNSNNSILYYEHWNIRSAEWIGNFDIINKEYKNINYQNIDHALNVIDIVLNKYKDYPNIWGLCPMNEPWEYTPEYILKYFYKKVYDNFIQIWNNDRVLIFHDSFRPFLWGNCDFIDLDKNNIKINIYLDTHQYKAWNEPVPFDILIDSIKHWEYPKTCFPVLIGEFSLATDNCQMWLNGFMDNLPDYPLQECYYEKCPRLLEGNNRNYIKKSINGPFGLGVSYPLENGYCPITTPMVLNKKISKGSLKEIKKNTLNLLKNIENKELFYGIKMKENNTDYVYENYYAKELYNELTNIFENKTIGWIFWNFRTSSYSYSWNYLSSYRLGYINNKVNNILYIKYNIIKINNNNNIKLYILYFFLIIIVLYISKKVVYKKKINIEYIPINNNSKNNYDSFMTNKYNINI
jgi:glucan 1,3-beta-glucosidase